MLRLSGVLETIGGILLVAIWQLYRIIVQTVWDAEAWLSREQRVIVYLRRRMNVYLRRSLRLGTG